VIVKLGVLIGLKTYAVTCASGASQKRRGCSTVKVVNNVVTGRSQFSRDASTRDEAAALQRDDLVHVGMIVEQRCNPILHEDVDLNVWQKASQSEE